MWHRNRRPPRTYRFWYTCIVYSCSPDMQKCCMGTSYENPRWCLRPEIVRHPVRNKMFVQFQRHIYILRVPNPKTQSDNDQRTKKQNGASKPETEIASDRNKICVKSNGYPIFLGRPI